jgi:hypothetical protein
LGGVREKPIQDGAAARLKFTGACDAIVGPAALLSGLEQTGGRENAEMLRRGRRGEAKQFLNLTNAKLAVTGEGAKDPNAVLIGECFGDGEEASHGFGSSVRQLAK